MKRSWSVAVVVLVVVVAALAISRCVWTPVIPDAGEPAATSQVAPTPPPERVHVRTTPPPLPEEWDRELTPEHYLVDLYDDEITHVLVRVVDDATGAPVAGAVVANWYEASWPHAEPWEPLRAHAPATDIDGFAFANRKTYGSWYFVDAPGYAPIGHFGFSEEFRLARGEDVEVDVRDWLERPVPGAVVELLLGCGHTPAVRTETTDARGRVVLRGIEPDRGTIWLRAPGLLGTSGYSSSPADLPLEDGRRILRARPARVLEGRVVNADGTPAGGVVVGVPDTHRGPWVRADADGRFRLPGAPPGSDVTVVYTWPAGETERRETFPVAPGVVTELRLPTGDESDDATEHLVPVRVSARVASEQPLVPEHLALRAVRSSDRLVEWWEPDLVDGAFELDAEMPPGTWTITVGDALGAVRPGSATVTVAVGGDAASVTLELQANPIWWPVVMERALDGTTRRVPTPLEGEFRIVARGGSRDATAAGRRDDDGAVVDDPAAFHVPAEGEFAVEYEDDRGRVARVVLAAPPDGLGPPLVLPYAPEDADEGLPASPLDYETDAFPDALLTVLLPDGRPAAGASVVISGGGPSGSYTIQSSLDEQGCRECGFTARDRVEVTWDAEDDGAGDAEHLVPLVAFIDSPGPWTLRWPSASVLVRAVDERGDALPELEVVIGVWASVFSDEGVVRLRGLPAGAVRLWVAAPGRIPHEVRLLLSDGETHEVTVRMRPRPARDE